MAGMRSRERFHCRECRRRGWSYRFTLGNHQVRKKCPRCKTDDFYSYERIYRRMEAKRKKTYCYCRNVPHPHRGGTHKLCEAYSGKGTAGWTGQDFHDYERRLFDPKNKKHVRTAFR